MLVVSFLVYSWSAMPGIAFSGLEQPGVKGEEGLFGIFEGVKSFFMTFFMKIKRVSIIFITDCSI